MTKEEQVEKAKKHMRRWNFLTKDTTGIAPYQILVDGKIRVAVVEAKASEIEMVRRAKDCDAMAVVTGGKKLAVWYALGSAEIDQEGYRSFSGWMPTPLGVLRPKKAGA